MRGTLATLADPVLYNHLMATGSVEPNQNTMAQDYDSVTNETWFVIRAYNQTQVGAQTTWTVRVRYHNYPEGHINAWSPIYECLSNNVPTVTQTIRHAYATICRDANGYRHIFVSTNPTWHFVTKSANDPSAWVYQNSLFAGTSAIYIYAITVSNKIYIFTGQFATSPTQLGLVIGTVSAGGAVSFGSNIFLATFSTANDYTYMTRPLVDAGGNITFMFNKNPNAFANSVNQYFGRYIIATGAFENIDGSVSTASGSLPITGTIADASYKVYDSGGFNSQCGLHCYDQAGNLHAGFQSGAAYSNTAQSGSNDLLHGTWTGAGTSLVSVTKINNTTPGGCATFNAVVPQTDGTVDCYYIDTDRAIHKVTWNAGSFSTPVTAFNAPKGFLSIGQNAIPCHVDAQVNWAENSLPIAGDFIPLPANCYLRMWAIGQTGKFLRSTKPDQVYRAPTLFLLAQSGTLSTDNLKYTASGTAVVCQLNNVVSGRYKAYVEFDCTLLTGATSSVGLRGNGFASTGTLLGNDVAGDSISYYGNSGLVRKANATVATLPTYTTGDNIGIAYDGVAAKIWFRLNGGNWNNDVIANQDPANGIGGFDTTGVVFAFFAVGFQTSTAAFTVRPSPSSWKFTAPVGFIATQIGPFTS